MKSHTPNTIFSPENNHHDNENSCGGGASPNLPEGRFFKNSTDPPIPYVSRHDITSKDHFLAIIALAIRGRWTYEDILRVLEYADWASYGTDLPKSKKNLWRDLGRDDSFVTRYHYCCICRDIIGKNNLIEKKCACAQSGPNNVNKVNYFVTLSLEAQLLELFGIPGISDALQYRFRRKKRQKDAIEDIYDSDLYANLSKPGGFLSNKFNFSYILNTDGAKPYKSSGVSAWPIFLQINELPPHARKKHILLAAIYVDIGDPVPNLFMKNLTEQAADLYHNGIIWKPDGINAVTSKFIPTICCMDSKARCSYLRMTQYNGEYGCTFCYIRGHRLPNIRHPKYRVEDCADVRTDDEIREHALRANESGSRIFGVIGPSALSLLPTFDLSNNIIPDSMHNIYLGVIKQHLLILLKSAKEPYYIGSPVQISMIDEFLSKIVMPSRVSRHTRSINSINEWKATEFRNFIYYGLTCLQTILPNKYLRHLSLLFSAVYTLNQDSITLEEINEAEKQLKTYMFQFQKYFGIQQMTYNIHLLLHQCASVRNWGPFWVTSAAVFESMNRKILDNITSPTAQAWQVYTRFTLRKFMERCAYDVSIPEKTQDFISKIMNVEHPDYDPYDIVDITDHLKTLGIGKWRNLYDWEEEELQRIGYRCNRNIQEFSRVKINGIEYRSRNYESETRFCNAFVYTTDFMLGEVVTIIECTAETEKEYGIFLQLFNPNGTAYGTNYIEQVSISDKILLITAESILGPAIVIPSHEDSLHAIRLPNMWESD